MHIPVGSVIHLSRPSKAFNDCAVCTKEFFSLVRLVCARASHYLRSFTLKEEPELNCDARSLQQQLEQPFICRIRLLEYLVFGPRCLGSHGLVEPFLSSLRNSLPKTGRFCRKVKVNVLKDDRMYLADESSTGMPREP